MERGEKAYTGEPRVISLLYSVPHEQDLLYITMFLRIVHVLVPLWGHKIQKMAWEAIVASPQNT